jgi:hypothetical protein
MLNSFLSFHKKPSTYSSGTLDASQRMMKHMIKNIGVRKAFIKSMFENHFWDGSGAFVKRSDEGSIEKFGVCLQIFLNQLRLI